MIVQTPSRRGQIVAACCAEAEAAGVRPGLPLAEALTLLSLRSPRRRKQGRGEKEEPLIEPHDPAADRRALEDLARWCHQFSPTVGLEDSDEPETLLVDATNLAPLYGGEAELVRQAAAAFKRRRLEARFALADTIGAAWAAAHYGDEDPSNLASLSLAALRLPAELLETLAELGLTTIADLMALPREQLRSRFGPLLLQRVDQASGRASEVIVAVDPPPDFAVEHTFEFPIARQEGIRFAVERLLERLCWLLVARNAAALRLECRFDCEGAPTVALECDLFQPTANVRHLLEVLDLHLERLRLAAPATAISLRVARHAPLVQRQGQLFETERTLADSRTFAGLVDRLASRLGAEAVVRCVLQNEAQPELAYREEPLVGGAGRRSRVRPRTPGPLDRPLLLGRPAPLETLAIVPDGPPIQFSRFGRRHDVVRHWGPERIETGWWRRASAWRDYYRVETSEGRRFWLFRQRRDGRWFLHGAFE